MNNWEKNLNESLNRNLESGMRALGKFIFNIVIGIGYGVKRTIKDRKLIIGLVVSIIVSIATGLFIDKLNSLNINIIYKWTIIFIGYIAPFIYLRILGIYEMNQRNYLISKLKDYKFYGVDGKLPKFIDQTKDDFGLEIFRFQAAIPIKTWKSRREELESLFNKTIVSIDQDTRKDRVILRTIPGSVEVPKFIKWDDKFINQDDGVVVVGKNAIRDIEIDLNKTPHILSAGETGSGKSVILRGMLWQLVKKGCRAYMIDFKGGVGAKRWLEIPVEIVVGIAY